MMILDFHKRFFVVLLFTRPHHASLGHDLAVSAYQPAFSWVRAGPLCPLQGGIHIWRLALCPLLNGF